jgi:hypothetical protein
MPDYDDPETEEQWCDVKRARVADYLRSQGVEHGRIGDWPAWHIPPHVAAWAIESRVRPEWIGWWVVSGDLPTDYISATDIQPPQHPRKTMRAIGERWLRLVETWNSGRDDEETRIAGPHSPQELAPLLDSRARLFIEWTDDDTLWEE